MSAPVYLFTGPEFGERNDEVAKVKADLKKKFGSSDEFLFYTTDTRVEDVVSQLRNESLFTPATCIVLRGAELIKKKDEIDLLSSWIDSVTSSVKNPNPSDSSVLILVSDEVSVDTKLDKLIPKDHRRIFWEMFEDRKESWLQNFFRKNGYSLMPDAASLILDMVENNTEELKSECGRFFLCFPAGHAVTAEDVEKILTHNREESPFTLFDAMSDANESPAKRLENSLAILQKILLSKNSNAVMLIAGLTSCFRRLALWIALHANGSSPDDFTLKTNGFGSKTARSQYSSASRIWGAGQCAAIIAVLSRTDMGIRSIGSSQEETQLEIMLYQIIIRNGAYCCAYESE